MRRSVSTLVALTLLLRAGPCVDGSERGQPTSVQHPGHIVTGTVSDSTGVLPGAEVRLVEPGRVVTTDEHGRFWFAGVPPGRVTLRVSLDGFATVHRTVAVPIPSPIAVRMDPDLRYVEEIVVSAAPWALTPLETAQQTDQVTAADVRRERMASLGEALAKVSGVAFIPTGNAMGTPVIRGISENRIRVLNEGVALNHQQFSWRHAPNVEPGFAERIELVRGPSSVLYGPEAMGGVINLTHAPLPLAPDGDPVFRGELSAGFSRNSGEWAGQGRLEGAFGRFGWRTDLVRRDGGDIKTPGGTLVNTDFDQTNATIMAGYTGAWGTARGRWHHWENDTGFYRPIGFRLGLHDDLVAGDVHVATGLGVVEVLIARQANHREAFDVPGHPATLELHQRTLTARTAVLHTRSGVLQGQLALEYQGLDNDTRIGTLFPDYETDNFAAMLFEEAKLLSTGEPAFHRLIVSAGFRGDIQKLAVSGPGATTTVHYGALTGALGVVVRLRERLAVASSLGRGWRPPSAFELHARGVHGGVAAFQVGNPALTEEANVNAELSVRYRGRHAQGAVSVYRNDFNNFIHVADSGRVEGALPVFVYRQSDARLTGVEATADVTPRPWLKLTASWASTNTRNHQTGRRLPQTPADRLQAGVQVLVERLGPLHHAHVGADAAFVGAGEISGPDEPLGTSTLGYEVYDLRAGFTRPVGRTRIEVALAVRNLFDREYRDFLWSYKPYAPNPGRDVRLTAGWRF